MMVKLMKDVVVILCVFISGRKCLMSGIRIIVKMLIGVVDSFELIE